MLGPEHPDTLMSVHMLAALFWGQGDFKRAEPLIGERSPPVNECWARSIPTR